MIFSVVNRANMEYYSQWRGDPKVQLYQNGLVFYLRVSDYNLQPGVWTQYVTHNKSYFQSPTVYAGNSPAWVETNDGIFLMLRFITHFRQYMNERQQ